MVVDKDRIRMDLRRFFTFAGQIEIDDQGFISCDGWVKLTSKIPTLPVKFKTILSTFYLATGSLISLEGCAVYVGGDFICSRNPIKTLQGAPSKVKGDVIMVGCSLTSLHGCPNTNGKLLVLENPLKSLEGIPEKLDTIGVSFDPQLPMLRSLTSRNILVEPLYPEHKRKAVALEKILNKYAGTTNPGDVLRCASELNESGFEGNAEW